MLCKGNLLIQTAGSPRASYSVYLSSMGRHEEAISEATRARDLDPLSIPIHEDVTRAYYHARQYDRAILAGLKTLELDPNHYRINGWLNFTYEQKGLYDQAVEAQMKGLSLLRVSTEEIEAGRAAYAAQGWKGYWQKELELTKQRAQRTYVLPYNIARICARVGDNEQAFEWLEKAYKDHSDHLVLLKVDPIFDGMRSDARYTSLLRRVGFDPVVVDVCAPADANVAQTVQSAPGRPSYLTALLRTALEKNPDGKWFRTDLSPLQDSAFRDQRGQSFGSIQSLFHSSAGSSGVGCGGAICLFCAEWDGTESFLPPANG